MDNGADMTCILPDGSRLGYTRYGRAGGRPAFYFHGLPGSRREGALLHAACLRANLELIAPERPGYGLSQPRIDHRANHRLDHRHADWAEQVSALADHLGFEQFYLIAISGGAPYALACAGRMPSRVRATAICCGLADITQPDLRAAMGIIARAGFTMAQASPTLLRLTYGTAATLGAGCAPGLSVDAMCMLNRRVDRMVLQSPPTKAIFTANLRAAFQQGSQGGVADLQAAVQGWGFELTKIAALHLWHGDNDGVVPHSHSQWLARQIPSARLKIIPGEGHFSLPVHYAEAMVNALVNEFPLPAS